MSTSNQSWVEPAEFPILKQNEIHIWRSKLNHCDLQTLLPTLSPDEKQRADRFYFEKDRNSYVASRGTLRKLLGQYLKLSPEVLSFQYSSYGKPSLNPHQPLQFNLSHSGSFAAFAFVYDASIGIDLEFIRPNVAEEEIAERFFSPAETQVLRSLPDSEQARAFFRCWTRKEAFIKARGDGLSLPLDQFDVTLAPNDPPALLRTAFDPAEASKWSLYELDIHEGYAAALAVERKEHQLCLFSTY